MKTQFPHKSTWLFVVLVFAVMISFWTARSCVIMHGRPVPQSEIVPHSNVGSLLGKSSELRTDEAKTNEFAPSLDAAAEAARFNETVPDDVHSRKYNEIERKRDAMCSRSIATFDLIAKVVDDSGEIVSGAEMTVEFAVKPGGWGTKPKYSLQSAQTDAYGLASFSGKTFFGMNWRVVKEGYYDSLGTIDLHRYATAIGYSRRRWFEHPLSFAIMLKKVSAPLPKSAYRHHLIPMGKQREFEYDLFEGEFLPPFGNGKNADLTMTLFDEKDERQGMTTWGMNIEIKDGGMKMCERSVTSSLSTAKTAPETGYTNCVTIAYSRHKWKTAGTPYLDPSRYIVFKVGAMKATGEHYGIIDSISFDGGILGMGYWMNTAANDRNVEIAW